MLIADITRALIGLVQGHYSPVMPTGRLRIMQIRNKTEQNVFQRPHFFFLKLLPLKTTSENEHSESELYYPNELEV